MVQEPVEYMNKVGRNYQKFRDVTRQVALDPV